MVSSRPLFRDYKTLLVVGLCLLGVTGGSYFLYEDINSTGQAGKGKALVKVERKQAKVRRKAAGSYIWSNIQIQDGLYYKDAIQTGVDSAATLRFDDGSLLEVNENSLVVIDDISNLSLNFLHGSFIVRSKTGDSQVTIGSDGKAKVVSFPIRLISPEPLSVFYLEEGKKRDIPFSWQFRAEDNFRAETKHLKIQIATNRSFMNSATLTRDLSKPGQTEFTNLLARGKYFWRIVAEAGDKFEPLTQPSEFQLVEAIALKPIWPNSNTRISTYDELASLQFRWLGNQPENISSGSHKVEISSDTSFRKIISSKVVNSSAGSALIEGVPAGSYFWRIISRYGDLGLASQTEKFTVEKAKSLAIELRYPNDKTAIEYKGSLRLVWDCDANNVEYLVETTNSEGKQVVSRKQKTTSLVLKDVVEGAYRWKVTAVVNNQKAGETEWRSFSIFKSPIVLKTPVKDQQYFFWDTPTQFSFSWQKDSVAEDNSNVSYQLDVAQDSLFKNRVATTVVKINEVASDVLKLNRGTLFWKVSLVNATGTVIKSSAVSRFTYQTHPVLPAPEPLSPRVDSTFTLLTDNAKPAVSWSEVNGAESYELALYEVNQSERNPASSTNKDKAVVRIKVDSEEYSFENLQPGKYYWTVRAIDRLERRGTPSLARTFNVSFGEVLDSPEITSEEVQ